MRAMHSFTKIILLSTVLAFEAACNGKTQPPPEPKPAPKTEPVKAAPNIVVDSSVHDFGKVPTGNWVTHVFKIKNTGTENLVIDRTEAS